MHCFSFSSLEFHPPFYYPLTKYHKVLFPFLEAGRIFIFLVLTHSCQQILLFHFLSQTSIQVPSEGAKQQGASTESLGLRWSKKDFMTDEHTGSMRIGQHMSPRAVQSPDHHSALSSLGGCSQRDAQSVSKHVSLFTSSIPHGEHRWELPHFQTAVF